MVPLALPLPLPLPLPPGDIPQAEFPSTPLKAIDAERPTS